MRGGITPWNSIPFFVKRIANPHLFIILEINIFFTKKLLFPKHVRPKKLRPRPSLSDNPNNNQEVTSRRLCLVSGLTGTFVPALVCTDFHRAAFNSGRSLLLSGRLLSTAFIRDSTRFSKKRVVKPRFVVNLSQPLT